MIKRSCLALIFATQKLRHYFLLHPLHLVTMSNPLRYLLSKTALSSRIGRWLLQLNEFNITVLNLKGIRSQAFADLLAQFLLMKMNHYAKTSPVRRLAWSRRTNGALPRWFRHSSRPGGGGQELCCKTTMVKSFLYLSDRFLLF